MAGTLLGPDQVRKLNAAYPTLVAHIRGLLNADHTGVGLMKVHSMVESFDSDEMARIFRELSFISPVEKKALVRAAIYELLAKESALFIAPEVLVVKETIAETVLVKPEPEKVFTPPPFKINVNGTTAFHGQRPADTPKPEPIVTSTHKPIVAAKLEAGKKEEIAQTEELHVKVAEFRASEDAKIAAAVASLQAATVPKVIEEPAVETSVEE